MRRSASFVRFLMAGGLAAAANYGSRFVFSLWLPFEPAVSLAFGVGLIAGFVLMRRFAFDAADKPVGPQILKYAAVNALALLQTLVISSVLARWLLPASGMTLHVEAVAHAAGVAIPAVTSFFGHRWLTFR